MPGEVHQAVQTVKTARLAIVIVSYNCRADLDACLQSLAVSPPAIAHEIVVVDNASPDGTPQHVRMRWPGVRLIEAGGNVGFSRGNNLGIRETRGDLVLLLNPDTIVPPQAIDTLTSTLERRPETAVVGPRIVDAAGRAELSFGAMVSPFAELQQRILVRGNDRGMPLIAGRVDRMTRVARRVDWVSGACLMIRRADLEAVGLLDERFFLYLEDVDLCAAIRGRGREVFFTPEAEVTHRRGRSRATAMSAAQVAYRRSHVAFYEKHHPRWAPLLRMYLRLRGEEPV
jgi:GT2 family glycosyltransferase